MRNLISGIIFALLCMMPAFASWDVHDNSQFQERINAVGFNILNSNRIENRLIFLVSNRIYSRDMHSDVWIASLLADARASQRR